MPPLEPDAFLNAWATFRETAERRLGVKFVPVEGEALEAWKEELDLVPATEALLKAGWPEHPIRVAYRLVLPSLEHVQALRRRHGWPKRLFPLTIDENDLLAWMPLDGFVYSVSLDESTPETLESLALAGREYQNLPAMLHDAGSWLEVVDDTAMVRVGQAEGLRPRVVTALEARVGKNWAKRFLLSGLTTVAQLRAELEADLKLAKLATYGSIGALAIAVAGGLKTGSLGMALGIGTLPAVLLAAASVWRLRLQRMLSATAGP